MTVKKYEPQKSNGIETWAEYREKGYRGEISIYIRRRDGTVVEVLRLSLTKAKFIVNHIHDIENAIIEFGTDVT